MNIVTGEADVLRSALLLIAANPGVLRCWRNNNAAVRRRDRSGREFWAFAGLRGVSDILGYVVGGSGRFCALEVKRPAVPAIGQSAGGLMPEQRAFLEGVREAGGVAVAFSDLRVLAGVIEALRRDPYAAFTVDGEHDGSLR